MKNILISALIIIPLMFQSCTSTMEEYAENPNSPETVTPGLMLSAAEVGMFANYSGQLSRMTNVLTQHLAGNGEGSQFVKLHGYIINENDNGNEWNNVYSEVLINTSTIIKETEGSSPYYSGIAKVITAFNLGYTTDLWGDIPYLSALNGLDGEFNPEYDTQESVINSIQTLLDEAIVELSKSSEDNTLLPSSDDLVYGGDVSKWIKAAYMIKARYAMRLSKVDESKAATDALNYIALGQFVGNEDDFNANFPGADGNGINQWSDFQANRANYIKMGGFFIDLMKDANDPRLHFFATEDDDGGYSGNDINNGEIVVNTSNVGPAIAGESQPIGMATYTEMKFIEAEASLILGDKSKAAAAYNDAVKSSVLKVTGAADPAFEGEYASADASTISLEMIITQKYVALFASMEPYADYRRTGLPALTPNPNSATKQIPLRLPTTQDERLYNKNATVVSDIYVPVWWDK